MGKKGRKLIALLVMFAMILQFTFGAGVLSVYAEGDEEGDTNPTPKATVSQEAAPAPAPQAEPETPAPAASDNEVVSDTPEGGNAGGGDVVTVEGDEGEETLTEEAMADGDEEIVEGDEGEEEEVIPGAGTHDDPYVLKVGQSVTLESTATGVTRNHTWNTALPSDRQYVSNDGNTFTYVNGTNAERLVRVNHEYQVRVATFPFARWENRTEVFYLKLLPQTFKVEFYLKDAGASGFELKDTAEVVIGGNATAPSCPATKEVDGTTYKFYGWYSDQGCTSAANLNNIREDKQFYAKYEAVEKIQFKKNINEAVNLPADITEAAGTSVHIGKASCTGYTFVEWNTDPEGNGTPYAGNTDIDMPEGGLTLYAIWEEGAESTTSIYYHAPNIVHTDRNVPVGETVTLWEGAPANPPGALFAGWSEGYPGPTADYYPGESYDVENGPVHLYAVWRPRSNVTLNLTANSDEKVYNGTEQKVEGYVGLEESADHPGYVLARTETFWVYTINYYVPLEGMIATGTNVGTYSTPNCAELYSEVISSFPSIDGKEFGSEHTFVKVTPGKLVITPAELKITTNSDEKEYDGTALTAGGTVEFGDGQSADITYEGGAVALFGEDTLNIRTIGSQTDPGSSKNGYEFDWGKPDDWGDAPSTAKKSNYKIVEESIGTLVVTPQPVPAELTFDLNGGNYDGDTSDYVMECTVGEEITIPDAPTRDGYEFVEWRGSHYQPGDTYEVVGDHNFKAIWKSTGAGTDGVDTGDNMGLGLTLGLMTLAAIALLGLIVWRRKEA